MTKLALVVVIERIPVQLHIGRCSDRLNDTALNAHHKLNDLRDSAEFLVADLHTLHRLALFVYALSQDRVFAEHHPIALVREHEPFVISEWDGEVRLLH